MLFVDDRSKQQELSSVYMVIMIQSTFLQEIDVNLLCTHKQKNTALCAHEMGTESGETYDDEGKCKAIRGY